MAKVMIGKIQIKPDVSMMARAFADMGSDEQAQFLALAYQEMGNYPGMQHENMGSHGREVQMSMIKRHFDEQPDARAMIKDLYEMTHAEKTPELATSWDALSVEDLRKAKVAMAERAGLYFPEEYLAGVGCNPDEAPGGFNDDPLKAAYTSKANILLTPNLRSCCATEVGETHADECHRFPATVINDSPSYIFYSDLSTDDVVIRDDAAYSKVGDIYLGTVQSVDAGRVVVKVGNPAPVNVSVVNDTISGGKLDNAILDALHQKKDMVNDVILTNEPKRDYEVVDRNIDHRPETWRFKFSRGAQVPPPGQDVTINGRAGTVLSVDVSSSTAYALVAMRPEVPETTSYGVDPGFISDIFPKSSNAHIAPAKPCDECKGTGFWTNPAGGRNAKSPCSLGCRAT